MQERNCHSELLLLRLFLIAYGIAQPPRVGLLVHNHTLFNPNVYVYTYIYGVV